jgi:hypothetical protein
MINQSISGEDPGARSMQQGTERDVYEAFGRFGDDPTQPIC